MLCFVKCTTQFSVYDEGHHLLSCFRGWCLVLIDHCQARYKDSPRDRVRQLQRHRNVQVRFPVCEKGVKKRDTGRGYDRYPSVDWTLVKTGPWPGPISRVPVSPKFPS